MNLGFCRNLLYGVIAIYYSLKHNNINHQIINIRSSKQHVSATVDRNQVKLEQIIGILNVRTLWDPMSFTLLITFNGINNVNHMGSHRVRTFSITKLCSSLA